MIIFKKGHGTSQTSKTLDERAKYTRAKVLTDAWGRLRYLPCELFHGEESTSKTTAKDKAL